MCTFQIYARRYIGAALKTLALNAAHRSSIRLKKGGNCMLRIMHEFNMHLPCSYFRFHRKELEEILFQTMASKHNSYEWYIFQFLIISLVFPSSQHLLTLFSILHFITSPFSFTPHHFSVFPLFLCCLPLLPPILFLLPPSCPERFCPHVKALDNPLSFIHDVLITNSVIDMLPNQCFSSIMADQSSLMLHRKLLDRLLGVNNVFNAGELDIGLVSIK